VRLKVDVIWVKVVPPHHVLMFTGFEENRGEEEIEMESLRQSHFSFWKEQRSAEDRFRTRSIGMRDIVSDTEKLGPVENVSEVNQSLGSSLPNRGIF
jgi:hypothetical protein